MRTPIRGAIERPSEDFEVVSLGSEMELVKQVGHPDGLDDTFDIAADPGTHGIGHTRLSTESRVDLSHSQPFWVRGIADMATVHNGHITNYHRLRTIYEQRGVRFFTENDSEVIGVYLADQLSGARRSRRRSRPRSRTSTAASPTSSPRPTRSGTPATPSPEAAHHGRDARLHRDRQRGDGHP